MANRVPRLTHFHIASAFYFVWEANQHTNLTGDEAIHALHGVAGCLNAFPGWVEVRVSSRPGTRFIRFIRRYTGWERLQTCDALEWLCVFEGYGIGILGWVHSSSGSPRGLVNRRLDF